MNYNRKVVVFTVVTTFILFVYSLLAAIYPIPFLNLDNISIVADVITKKPILDSAALALAQPTDTLVKNDSATGPLLPRAISQYKLSKTITAFYSDSTKPALPKLMRKLRSIKQGKKGKVRIAWLGDSMIEGDYLTQTFRKKIQQFTGSFGVGFIPATSVTAEFRTTALHKWEGDWVEENFKTKELSGNLFISGHLFHTRDGELRIKDNTVKDSAQLLEKALICGPAAGAVNITVNGQPKQFTADKLINRLVLDSSASHSISIRVQDEKLPVYGLSMEPQSGVVVDNFSFRGITGLELNKLDTSFLKAVQEENPYDLVVLEYGANLMFRPNDSDYSWFQKHIIPVIKRLQKAMPNAEFLIISTADRAFKYGETFQTAIGINNLIKIQADLAYSNGDAFFNMFSSMGGSGTIVRWAEGAPTLANKDYIHPNLKGSEILGGIFYDAFLKDYGKLEGTATDKTPVPEATPEYIISSINSIIDKKNNLEWYIADDKNYTWPEAAQWAKTLSVNKGNWALPTAAQLLTLYNKNASAGAGFEYQGKLYTARINPAFSKIGHSSWAWTNENIDSEKAYSVNLNQGIKVESSKNVIKYPIRALAVRKINLPKI